jgi:hypothetical protein
MKLKHYALLVALAAALPTVALSADDAKGKTSKSYASVNGVRIPQIRADATRSCASKSRRS